MIACRDFLAKSLAVLGAWMQRDVKAIGFDAFVIFDPRSLSSLADSLFPGQGSALAELWRVRQFEYCWLRNSLGRYADFWTVTRDALIYAAHAARLELTNDTRDRLMQGYLELKAYDDVRPGLERLRDARMRLGFVSNMTRSMIEANLRANDLENYFDQILSTDRIQTYKPDPRAYRMAIEGFGLRQRNIGFAAFGGWDAVGAVNFGYSTFWVNRLGLPAEELNIRVEDTGSDLSALTNWIGLPA